MAAPTVALNPMAHPTEDIFSEALEVPERDLTGFLEQRCDGDRVMIAEVRSLLESHRRCRSFLEHPVAVVAAETQESPPHDEWLGRTMGPYRLVKLLGAGGCGRVYLAEQEEPVRRRVAVKIVHPALSSRNMVARFEAERQALVELNHPNIAKLFDPGRTQEGIPFFAMEYVEGPPLTLFCDRRGLSPNERLDLFLRVCDAVQHVHLRGIIHRDLKPSNILVSELDGQPRVIDFGIAKASDGHLAREGAVTLLGGPVGTLEYMSPEQVKGAPDGIDARADVYALGVVLYELLTGSRPFEVSQLSLHEAQRWVCEHEPLRASTRVLRLSGPQTPATPYRVLKGDLDWVLLKAMEKDRSRRYTTVQELAADIARFRRNEPVLARPPSAAYRARKFIARNKAISVATGLVALALMAATIVSALWAGRAHRAEANAIVSSERNQHLAYRNSILAASALVEQDPITARRTLGDAPEALREWEWHYLRARAEGAPAFHDGTKEMSALAADREGRRVAIGFHNGTILVWSRGAPKPLPLLGHSKRIQACSFSPDGRLLSCASDGNVLMWDVESGVSSVVGKHDTGVASAGFDSHGELVISGDSAGLVCIWSTKGDMLESFTCSKPVTAVGLAGQDALVATNDGVVRIRERRSGARKAEWKAAGSSIRAMHVIEAQNEVVTASLDGSVARWDLSSGQLLHLYSKPGPSAIKSLCVSSDGSLIAAGDQEGDIRVWDRVSGVLASTLPAEGGFVEGLAFFGSSTELISASWGGRARYWQVGFGHAQRFIPPTHGAARRIAFTPDSAQIAAITASGAFCSWSVATGQRSSLREGAPAAAWAMDTGGVRLAQFRDGVEIVEASTGDLLENFKVNGKVLVCAIDDKGKTCAMGDSAGGIAVWSVPDRRLIRSAMLRAGITALGLSSDGRFLAAGDRDGTGVLWDLARGGEGEGAGGGAGSGAEFQWSYPVTAVAFSLDSESVAFGLRENSQATLRVIATKDAREVGAMGGSGKTISAIAFSSSGRRIVTGGDHHSLRIWNLDDGRELLTLADLDSNAEGIAFSPDGLSLAACTSRGGIYIYTAAPTPWPWAKTGN